MPSDEYLLDALASAQGAQVTATIAEASAELAERDLSYAVHRAVLAVLIPAETMAERLDSVMSFLELAAVAGQHARTLFELCRDEVKLGPAALLQVLEAMQVASAASDGFSSSLAAQYSPVCGLIAKAAAADSLCAKHLLEWVHQLPLEPVARVLVSYRACAIYAKYPWEGGLASVLRVDKRSLRRMHFGRAVTPIVTAAVSRVLQGDPVGREQLDVGVAALLEAAVDVETLQYLVDPLGLDASALRDSLGRMGRDDDMSTRLLACAEGRAPDRPPESAVREAALDGDFVFALGLVQRGAYVRATPDEVDNAIHAAVEDGGEPALTLVRALLEAGHDPDLTGMNGTTPLYEAAAEGRLAMVDLLLGAGAWVDAVTCFATGHAQAPLHSAVSQSNGAVFGRLLAAGADPNVRDWAGYTPLHIAMGNARPGDLAPLDAIRRLLEAGADPNATSDPAFTGECGTPLTGAIGYLGGRRAPAGQRLAAVQLLLDAGADPNLPDVGPTGWTPLHWAGRVGDTSVLECLVTRGAIARPDRKGQWPADVARDEDVKETLARAKIAHDEAQKAD